MFTLDEAVDGTYTISVIIDGRSFDIAYGYQSRAAAIDTIITRLMELLEPTESNSEKEQQ